MKTFEIIEILNQFKSLALKDITEKAKMPKPTIFRILSTLQKLNYVSLSNDTQQYSLSYKFIAIAKDSINGIDVVGVSKPYMSKLRDTFGETINLAKLISNEAIFLYIVESNHQFRFVDTVGDKAPLHSTAIGKAIAAFLNEDELNDIFKNYDYTRFTKTTIQNFSDLKSHLTEVRKSGISIDNEEGHEGVLCIGVPLFNAEHKPFAAISISIPKVRAKKKLLEKIKQELPRVGIQISLEMGVTDIRKCLSI
ncbi:IclR family transcriptional regulator [candidate division KSB1 bacterium]|nr:IclR family transcriptional regulator [candidate division KSB1 bacterium]